MRPVSLFSRNIQFSRGLSMNGLHIRKFLLSPAILCVAVLFSLTICAPQRSQAQILHPAPTAASVHITKGPSIESIVDGLAIIRWTSNNPGGTPEHFGVVHYGVDPAHLDETAKSHIQLNQSHPDTIFRVRVDGLKPKTKYYYSVGSMGGNGRVDPVKSGVYHFTTP
jgi:Purple acid Phosphatase, N-terminal domain